MRGFPKNSIVFMRGEDVVGRYSVSEKATIIVSAPSVVYENDLDFSEYVKGRTANITLYADGRIELLLDDYSYLNPTMNIETDRIIELATDVSIRREVAKDTRVYVFGRKFILAVYSTEDGYMIRPYKSNRDTYVLLKPLIQQIRRKHVRII